MPNIADLRLAESLTTFFFLFVPIAIGVLLGVTALGIAWGGRRIGMLFGVLGLASSLLGLGMLLLTAPHLWWIAVIPIAIGTTTVRALYHHTGPATARRLRFDLRGLFALILLTSLILSGITSQYRQMRIEEQAATTLEALPESSSNQIRWSLGRVTEVIFISLRDPANFDQAADALERFSQLHVLQINDPLPGRVTQRLGHLTSLRSLLAQGIPVTDDDLRPLANLQNLEYLELDARQLTDAGLVHLRNLQRLRALHLYNANQITPAAMANLRAALPRLDNP